MTSRDWTMEDVVLLIDGGRAGIYDGWVAAVLTDGSVVNRWDKDDHRYISTQVFIDEWKEVYC